MKNREYFLRKDNFKIKYRPLCNLTQFPQKILAQKDIKPYLSRIEIREK